MIKKSIKVNGSKILLLGITFKENCPDVRNTKVVDVVAALKDYETNITVYDPWANPAEVMHEYGLVTTTEIPKEKFDAVILGVAHKEFLNMDFASLQKENSLLYDVKGILGTLADGKL
jgi:UDP-N-acetyl-D-galactosamine dehydrogenase